MGSAALLASAWPATQAYAKEQSAELTRAGQGASGGESENDFRLATWLDSSNDAAFAGLAQAQVAAGQPNEALQTLTEAGEGREVARTKVRILLELGRYTEAAGFTAILTSDKAIQEDLVLTAIALSLAQQPAAIASLKTRVSSPAALQALARAEAGDIPLATELYARGLLRSSSALLLKLPVSFERNLLLSRIVLSRTTPASLSQAEQYLSAALTQSPSQLEARRLLYRVYQAQGNQAGANHEAQLIRRLEAGQP